MTDSLAVGTVLPELALPPIRRSTLALFAGASGDHNPIHIDSDFAREAGQEDVFAHGMLSMAYLGRMLTNWQPQAQLRRFKARFTAITHLYDVVCCRGEVVELSQVGEEWQARCKLVVVTESGTQTVIGEAWVGLPQQAMDD
ncbi:Acyl dehydratase [Ferrimonas sediminum]|uniref:Acyl dehydratase n=1 Tax=Ferrimonas sediminum TaxID=718193 RepID=A0A1G8N3T9_9GAMM|nr:MaoC/PaaZ C-terminal domain-containing protein [Ferrimonas sediminum]SDI74828.1 Acyl dehydratase [Ferrimonas sediminum]